MAKKYDLPSVSSFARKEIRAAKSRAYRGGAMAATLSGSFGVLGGAAGAANHSPIGALIAGVFGLACSAVIWTMGSKNGVPARHYHTLHLGERYEAVQEGRPEPVFDPRARDRTCGRIRALALGSVLAAAIGVIGGSQLQHHLDKAVEQPSEPSSQTVEPAVEPQPQEPSKAETPDVWRQLGLS